MSGTTGGEILIAMGQMLVEGGKPEANLARAERNIAEAGRRGCRAVVLPECMDLGWMDESARRLAEPIPGPRSERLSGLAREHRIHVAAGLTERAGDRIYNAAVLIDPAGRIVLHHRKINELRFGPPHDCYATGDRLAVADTELGRVGLTICADNFSSSLMIGHTLGRMGAKLILSPCAWAVPSEFDNEKTPYGQEWLDPYSELARAHELTIVGVSNVGPIASGPWAGRRCIGNSLAVGPGGRVLCRGKHGIDAEQLIVLKLSRASGGVPDAGP